MLYKIRLICAALIAVLLVGGMTGAFYPVKVFDVQFSAVFQRNLTAFSWGAALALAGVVIVTAVFGRVYCSTVCPLGLFQELLTIVFRRKQKPQKNRALKYFAAAAAFGATLGGSALVLRQIEPYTMFVSAASGAAFGLAFLAVLTVLVWFKGRWFCANLCPVGAALGLIAKHARNKIAVDADKCASCGLCAMKCPAGCIDFKSKTVDNETCVKCFKCLNVCRRKALRYGKAEKKNAPAFSPERREILRAGAAAALFAAAIGGGAALGKKAFAKVKNVLLPAGAKNARRLANRCLNCNLCVQNCPMKILKKADGDFPAVHLDISNNFCAFDCRKCGDVCPSGAIERLPLSVKQRTQIGVARVDEDACVRCGLCVMKCPRQIIERADGEPPRISADKCVGCGACQNACPVQAIAVEPVFEQRILQK